MIEPHKPEMNEIPPSPQSLQPSSYESDWLLHRPTSSPLVQYALMINAGSIGSRIHGCGPSPGYEYETFVQKHPGLSAYAAQP